MANQVYFDENLGKNISIPQFWPVYLASAMLAS